MKKSMLFVLALFAAISFGSDNIRTCRNDLGSSPPQDTAGFTQSRESIQSTYNSMYLAMPQDQQNRIQSASLSMQSIRLRTPADAQTFFAAQRLRADYSMITVVSQMSLTDAAKAQIDNSRREIYQRINEKIADLKARRASHH